MLITMQGNWKVVVKTKNAAFPQRFVVSGATTGNGNYNGTVGTTATVSGTSWTISIQHNPGTGFRASDVRLKTPSLIGSNYVFDVESNDSGADLDFDDLILTCTSPAGLTDYLIFGHVSDYFGNCLYNPCFRRHIVIDTAAALAKAMLNKDILAALKQLYPERVANPIKVNPNPPDPPFIPIVIPVFDTSPLPLKTASVFRRLESAEAGKSAKSAASAVSAAATRDQVALARVVPVQSESANLAAKYTFDRVSLGSLLDTRFRFCVTEDVAYQTLRFLEYDRTAAELAGGAYSGAGDKLDLGFALTDMNGNYVFRFTQTLSELVNEVLNDVAPGENAIVESHPDLIVRIMDTSTPNLVLFESAPYFNVQNLRRIDICLPKSVLRPTRICASGNLIGQLGTIDIPNPPNTTFAPAVRHNAFTNLSTDGKITNHDGNPSAPQIDCGCWEGFVDLKGCMNSPAAVFYTVRFKPHGGSWQFVSQEYHHKKYSDPDISSGHLNTKVGPFAGTTLNVPGFGSADVPHYKNIQREMFFLGTDWLFDGIDILMTLNTSLYQTDPQVPVDFRVDTYDAAGAPIVSDLITMFIDNTPVDFTVNDAFFDASVSSDCVLFALTNGEIAGGTIANPAPLPLKVFFKANQLNGFLGNYSLGMGKGKFNTAFPTTDNPAGKAVVSYVPASDPTCLGFRGTIDTFGGTPGFCEIDLTPTGKWLNDDQSFCTFTVDLTTIKRATNGYTMEGATGGAMFIFGLQRVNP